MSIYSNIFTERLILREFDKNDFEAIHEYLSNEKVLEYMPFNPTSKEETINYLQRFIKFQTEEPRNYIRFVVMLKGNMNIIGECGINILSIKDKCGELIYRFNTKYWNNGYATESAKRLINFGFFELKLHRIEAIVDIRNTASIKILNKIGMNNEGCLKEHKLQKGHWRSSYMFSMLEKECQNE